MTNNLFKNFGFPGAEKLMERMFRRVDNVAWDLMTGKVGIRTEDGVFAVEGEGEEATVVGNIFDGMSMPIPAFAQSTSVKDVKVGDLILRGKAEKPAWVTEVKETPAKVDGGESTLSFKLLKVGGETVAWKAPKLQMLGFDAGGVMVVRTLLAVLPGGKSDLTGLQGMLMPMMMSGMLGGEDGGDFEELLGNMLPMMLFMGQQNGGMSNMFGGGNGGMNPMAMMLQMKMMERMLGNKGSGRRAGGRIGYDEDRPFSRS